MSNVDLVETRILQSVKQKINLLNQSFILRFYSSSLFKGRVKELTRSEHTSAAVICIVRV